MSAHPKIGPFPAMRKQKAIPMRRLASKSFGRQTTPPAPCRTGKPMAPAAAEIAMRNGRARSLPRRMTPSWANSAAKATRRASVPGSGGHPEKTRLASFKENGLHAPARGPIPCETEAAHAVPEQSPSFPGAI
jgi:hypothetical protein